MCNRLTMSYPTIGRLICLQKHFENSQISRFLFHLKNNTIHSTAMLLACTYHHIVGPFRQGETKSGRHPRGCLCARARTHTTALVMLYRHGRTFVACEVHAGWIGSFRLLVKQSQQCFFWGNLEDRNAKLAIKIWPFFGTVFLLEPILQTFFFSYEEFSKFFYW